MEVRCEKCDTTYELDEARVAESGVEVHCAHCGHEFLVRRRNPAVTREMSGLQGLGSQLPPTPHGSPALREAAPKERVWHLRLRHTREIVRFRDLRVLRQWIIEKRITRDDDISRGGKAFRRLGSIVELEAFFHEAEQASAALLRTGRSSQSSPGHQSSQSSPGGLPLPQEPSRLRSNTPGHGVGPVSLGPHRPSFGLPPEKTNVATLMGPAAPATLREDAAPMGPLRLSATGRTMRPRLQGGAMPPPVPAAPPVSAAPPPAAPSPALSPGGAIPRHIAGLSGGDDAHRHVLPPAEAQAAPAADQTVPALAIHDEPSGPTPPSAQSGRLSPLVSSEPALAIPLLEDVIQRSDPVPRALQESVGRFAPGPEAPAEDKAEEDEEWQPPGVRPRTVWIGAVAAALVLALLGVYGFSRMEGRGPAAGAASAHRRGASAYAEGMRLELGDSEEDFQQAHDAFLRAVGADEGDPRPLAALAELHTLWSLDLQAEAGAAVAALRPLLLSESQHHAEQARHYANQAQALGGAASTPEVERALALVLIQAGAPADQVEAALRRGQGAVPPDGAAYARALLALREGKPAEAQAALRPLMEGSGAAPPLRALVLMAQATAAAGDRDGARVLWQKVRERSPRHRRAELALLALTETGPDGGAAPDLASAADEDEEEEENKAGKPEPAEGRATDYPTRLAQASRLLENGKGREAQRIYQELLPEHDQDPDVHVGLGLCAVDSEHFQAAVGHYRAALSRRPDYGPALIALAEVYKLRGDNQEALRWYRTYLDKHPDGTQASLARSNISRLEALGEARPALPGEGGGAPAEPPLKQPQPGGD